MAERNKQQEQLQFAAPSAEKKPLGSAQKPAEGKPQSTSGRSFFAGKRTAKLFDHTSKEPFKLSRTKIDNFLKCARCFYLDRRLGIAEPPGYPFNLNSAVDELLKKEFDAYRTKAMPHPLMEAHGFKGRPFAHDELSKWRENFVGIQHHHVPSNFLVFGAVDDLWIDDKGNLAIVDYKATSKTTEVNLDAEWQDGYKRQMEMYQWLFRQNGFKVADTGYFVYCNGRRDKDQFGGVLHFDIKIIPYTGNPSWVEPTLMKIRETLSGELPPHNAACQYCEYRRIAHEAEKRHLL